MLGMAPAALATGIGSDIQRPLATVVLGGLCSTLVLTLSVMPATYYLVERRGEKRAQRKAEETRAGHRPVAWPEVGQTIGFCRLSSGPLPVAIMVWRGLTGSKSTLNPRMQAVSPAIWKNTKFLA